MINLLGLIVVISQLIIQTVANVVGQKLKSKQSDNKAPAKIMILGGILTSLIFGARQGMSCFVVSISVVLLVNIFCFLRMKGEQK